MSDFENTDPEIFLTTFGEDVVYTPGGGVARTITAIVDRDQGTPEGQIATEPKFRVTVANRTTSAADDDDGVGGIGSDELSTGTDTIALAPRVGEALVTMTIVEMLEQDEEMLELEVG